MNLISVYLGLFGGIFAGGIILPANANAQVRSDGTTNTIVNPSGNDFNIINGIEKGNNLFHSFSNFSLPTGGSATFDLINTPNITTIFSRVTGGNVSNIDGLIQTLNGNNSASLFLMNPNGIVFGENASLNIGGSFVGTTANSIKFSDGTEFNAVNPNQPPLLTMSVPVGLQMGQNSGDISIQGNGHQLSIINSFLALEARNTGFGLRVNSGNTLALIGGNLTLNGGIVSADGGHITLGAVATKNGNSAQVKLNNVGTSWTLDYSQVEEFKDINLTKLALVDASGVINGSIQIQGQTVSLKDGSLIALENKGEQPGGDIQINATKLLEFADSPNANPKISLFNSLMNGIFNDATSSGQAGDIIISTEELLMQNGGGFITNRTFTETAGGNIVIDSKDINMLGSSSIDSGAIVARTLGAGNSGNVTINTERLKILNQGFIGAVSTALGSGGNITINTQEKIELIAPDFSDFGSAGIGAGAVSESGNGGNVTINTGKLILRDGMLISSSTYSNGNSGSIVINASEAFEIGGARVLDNQDGTTTVDGSMVSSAVIFLNPFLRQLFGLPDVLGGNGGNIIINTPRLKLEDNGLITVGNDGTGDAGNIIINAESISLNNQGEITATTASGEGGNLNLNLKSDLILRNNSLISTEALGTGNGGNITINSPIILGLENSDIIANAVDGNGGNINITTQGIFELKYRDQLTDESDITASSQFGVKGTVDINNFGVDPNSGLVELPANLVDSSQQIAAGCAETSGSSFVVTGRGGIPQNPTQDVRSDRTWSDVRNLNAYRQNSPVIAKIPETSAPLVQATSWRRNVQGKIELVADKSIAPTPQLLTCAAVTKN
ncbi:S-layer family protein [Nodularia harveyana UHCC-0300]|uniref:S-layer family protein n=1 Tax=Nodularia harveyana UHCC-0300 TaxID=2974287 RepID=A0ABU5U927_9CYAN|nr:S-layer family protein [Nodularia harveyana]MEA5580045.1 S-layer family protein [Nodularia harveyana UHCC-0300]